MEVNAVSNLLKNAASPVNSVVVTPSALTGSARAMTKLTAESASLVSGGATSSEPQGDDALGGGWGNEPPAAAFAVTFGGGWGNEPLEP